MRLFLSIVCLMATACVFAQISDYNHPPTILGHEQIDVAPNKSIEITTDLLVIHDMDEKDISTFDVTVNNGTNYSVAGNTVTPATDFVGNIHVGVKVSDGEFESGVYFIDIKVGTSNSVYDYSANVAAEGFTSTGKPFGLVNTYFEVLRTPTAQEGVFYVSPNGDDNNEGTIDAPLKTLLGAKSKVRNYKNSNGIPEGGITVYFREGEYFMESTVNFDGNDSGEQDKYITYRAYPKETVRFTGAKKIEYEWFQDAPSDITNKIKNANARDKIKMIDLKTNGILTYGEIGHVGYVVSNQPISPANIFIDGKAMHLSRYPNTENIDDVKSATGKNTFVSESGVVTTWENTGNIWIDGSLSKAWEWKKNKIATISSSGQVTTVYDYHSEIRYQDPKMFYFNIIEELDYPEEYFIDRDNGILYFYPPEGTNEKSDIRISQSDKKLVYFSGTNYVSFVDVYFDGTRNNVIELNNASNNIFKNCEIGASGLDGIRIKGSNNKVFNCEIHDVGANGVYLNGGNSSTLEPARNLVENCIIRDFSQERKVYNPGLTLFGVGQVVRYVELYNGPHMAIKVKGNNHIIEYCDFHDAPKEYSDMLAVYFNTGSFMLHRGTIIRKNKFHDVTGTWKQSAGVYLDNETCGVLIEDNYFFDNIAEENGWSVMIHGGADNIVRRNVFTYCSYPFAISLRLNGYASGDFEGRLDMWENEFRNDATDAHFTNFPELNRYFDDEGITPDPMTYTYNKTYDDQGNVTNYWDRRTPSTNVFKDNLVYNESQDIFAMPGTSGNQENRGYYVVNEFRIKDGVPQENLITDNNYSVSFEPGFVDYANRNLKFTQTEVNSGLLGKQPFLLNLPFLDMGLKGEVGVQFSDMKLDTANFTIEIIEHVPENYTYTENIITPADWFIGRLTIPVKLVTDSWESEELEFILNVENASAALPADLDGICLYPNVASDHVNLKAPVGSDIYMVNSIGKYIDFCRTDSDITRIDTAGLASGKYFLIVDGTVNPKVLGFTKN